MILNIIKWLSLVGIAILAFAIGMKVKDPFVIAFMWIIVGLLTLIVATTDK